jgi:hypothetical protein
MSAWIATALGVAALIASGAADAGPRCTPTSWHPCVDASKAVDLNSVPDIAKQIVSGEPISQQQKTRVAAPATPPPYTGPIFGATPATSGKRTPTVGYSWSLE